MKDVVEKTKQKMEQDGDRFSQKGLDEATELNWANKTILRYCSQLTKSCPK